MAGASTGRRRGALCLGPRDEITALDADPSADLRVRQLGFAQGFLDDRQRKAGPEPRRSRGDVEIYWGERHKPQSLCNGHALRAGLWDAACVLGAIKPKCSEAFRASSGLV